MQGAADQVAQKIGQQITPDFVLSQQDYQSAFTQRMIAEAVETKNAGDIATALKILEAVHLANQNNLVAARLLVQTLVETGASVDAVVDIARPALASAKQNNSIIDEIRLSFWLAVSQFMSGDIESASSLIQAAEVNARSINDWLYLAYIQEILGQLRQSLGQFSEAGTHFQQARQYHRILHCPLGESNTLMHLSRLAYAQQNHSLAMEMAEQALYLVQSRNLADKLSATQKWLEKLSSEQESSL